MDRKTKRTSQKSSSFGPEAGFPWRVFFLSFSCLSSSPERFVSEHLPIELGIFADRWNLEAIDYPNLSPWFSLVRSFSFPLKTAPAAKQPLALKLLAPVPPSN